MRRLYTDYMHDLDQFRQDWVRRKGQPPAVHELEPLWLRKLGAGAQALLLAHRDSFVLFGRKDYYPLVRRVFPELAGAQDDELEQCLHWLFVLNWQMNGRVTLRLQPAIGDQLTDGPGLEGPAADLELPWPVCQVTFERPPGALRDPDTGGLFPVTTLFVHNVDMREVLAQRLVGWPELGYDPQMELDDLRAHAQTFVGSPKSRGTRVFGLCVVAQNPEMPTDACFLHWMLTMREQEPITRSAYRLLEATGIPEPGSPASGENNARGYYTAVVADLARHIRAHPEALQMETPPNTWVLAGEEEVPPFEVERKPATQP